MSHYQLKVNFERKDQQIYPSIIYVHNHYVDLKVSIQRSLRRKIEQLQQ